MNFFKRKLFAQDELKKENATPEVEAIGSSGTEIYGGYLYEEYLRELLGTRGQERFKHMVRSDYNAKMCVNAVKNSIRSTPSEIRVSKLDQNAEAKKLLCERVLKDIATPESKLIDEMLTCIEQGFYIGEVTFKNVLNKPIKDQDGKIVLQSYTSIKDIAFRDQETIEKWYTDENGRLKGVNQQSYGDLQKKVDIMADQLVHIAIEQTGSNFEGISMLRPAYGCYLRKNKYIKFNAIGIEKYGVPFVKGVMPEGADENDKRNFSSALKSIVNSTKTFIRLGQGYEVELSNVTYDPTKTEASIDKEDMRMTRAFLANFLLLGQANAQGSRAVSNDLGDFFINGLEYIATKIEDAINKELKRVQIANFGEQDHYAKFKFSGISDRFGSELANILSSLTSSGVIIADDDLEDSARKRIGLPEANRETSRGKQESVSLSERVKRKWLK